jgi:hypothetical protein
MSSIEEPSANVCSSADGEVKGEGEGEGEGEGKVISIESLS